MLYNTIYNNNNNNMIIIIICYNNNNNNNNNMLYNILYNRLAAAGTGRHGQTDAYSADRQTRADRQAGSQTGSGIQQ